MLASVAGPAGGRSSAGGAPTDVPARVGHIRVVGTLGAGGMGEVYVGWDETLKRRVALKAIRHEHRMRPEVRARFLREARVLSQLDHPNVCRIFDFVAGADRDFLVLELIEGESLAVAIRRGIDRPRRLAIAEQVAAALAVAHSKGVVHRDLKPHNVMLAESGEVKVLDFGIARSAGMEAAEAPPESSPGPVSPLAETLFDSDAVDTELQPAAARRPEREPPEAADHTPLLDSSETGSWTVQGSVLGSPGYLSPEQARGHSATTASDMYAFGLLLQELFTGKAPHPPGLTTGELVRRARHAETLPLEGVRSDVAALIGGLLDPAAAARPTAVEALRRLRWSRDRPRRRLTRAAIAAVLVVLVLGGLKYTWDLKTARDLAEHHRDLAEHHRAQADDLIGMMLGDLRDKLAGVGRLELLDDVADEALDYFESLPTEDRTEQELFRRSKALRQIGEVRIAQGDLPAAMEAFEESGRLTEALVERNPDHGEWLLGLGHSHFWKGNVHWLQGDLRAALERFESYRELTDRLVEGDPDETEWRLERGYAATNLAAVHEAMGDHDAANAALRDSLAIKEDLLRSRPDHVEWRRSLANGLSWQGRLLTAGGDLAGAAESYGREREVRRALLADDPENPDARLLMAVNSSHSGELAAMRGDVVTGRQLLEEARELYRGLVRHDPENSDWHRDLAITHLQLADLPSDDVAEAEASLTAGEEILRGLVVQDPSNADWQRHLAHARMARASAALAAGHLPAARATAREAESKLSSLLEDNPGQGKILRELATSRLVLGQAMAASGDAAGARLWWQRADEVLESQLTHSKNLELLAVRARVLLHLERIPEAAAIVRQLTDAGYARPDLLRLAERHGLVFGDVAVRSP